jgi:diguanylate cyclase (GGDEF)-like protein
MVLTIAYILELVKGNRTLIYLIEYLMFTWIPLLVNYAISLIVGRGNPNIKYGVTLGYLVFYFFTMLTSQSTATFCYIFPMMCAMLMYDDIKLTDRLCQVALAINIISILFEVRANDWQIGKERLTFFEIQIACLALCAVFLHKTGKVMSYGNKKLLELNNSIGKDELTGLYNRYFLKNYMETILPKQGEEKEIRLSLAIIDIDSFKGINDTYGHKFGDLVLKRVSRLIQLNIERMNDTYAIRTGGDEFLIVSNCEKDRLGEICKKICSQIADAKLKYGEKDVDFTVSIGVSSSNKIKDNASYLELYELADQMLYTVKLNGKSSVAISEEEEK